MSSLNSDEITNNPGLTLDAFLTEHGHCWRVSGLDMENHEDESVVRVLLLHSTQPRRRAHIVDPTRRLHSSQSPQPQTACGMIQ